MINSRLIARIRETMALFFTDSRDVKGNRGSPPAMGTVYTAMPCRVVPSGMARGSAVGEMLDQTTFFILEYPYTYTLMRNDVISSSEDVYRVVDLIQDMTPTTHHKATIERVKIT